jgi:hypothetical protein
VLNLPHVKNTFCLDYHTGHNSLANTGMSKDFLNEDLLKEARPLYQSCLEDYKKTMSDEDARKTCTEKSKSSYEKMTNR